MDTEKLLIEQLAFAVIVDIPGELKVMFSTQAGGICFSFLFGLSHFLCGFGEPQYCGWILDRRWRAAILSVAWLVLIAGALSSEVERGIESKSIWASSYADLNDFEYYIDGNEIYIKDYRGNSKKVRINSSYNVDGTAMNVVSFDGTFALDSVTSVVIPDGTRYMSNNIFNSCGIEYVYLPASLEEFKGWSYFHNVEKIYYGGTEEQWSNFCTVDRSRLDVVQIIYNADPNDLK